MHPVLWEFHGITFYSYGAFIVLGMASALLVLRSLAKQVGLPDHVPLEITLVFLVGGFVGAHLLDVIIQWHRYLARPIAALNIFASHASIGGLILAAFALYWWARRNRYPVPLIYDITAIAASLGYAVGRIGCFLAGCCYGRPADVPWAVVFSDPRCYVAPGLRGVPLHPTQLYSSLASLLIFAVLLRLWKSRAFPLQVSLVFLVGYALYRFSIELFRGDPERGRLEALHLSPAQLISVLILALSLPAYFLYRRRANSTASDSSTGPTMTSGLR